VVAVEEVVHFVLLVVEEGVILPVTHSMVVAVWVVCPHQVSVVSQFLASEKLVVQLHLAVLSVVSQFLASE
jgi:hypothetical protein